MAVPRRAQIGFKKIVVRQNLPELENVLKGRNIPAQPLPEFRRILEKKEKKIPLGSEKAKVIYEKCYFNAKNLPPETRDKVNDILTKAWEDRDKLSKEDWNRIEKSIDWQIKEAEEERRDPLKKYKSF